MLWNLLLTAGWTASVYASVLHLNRDGSPQVAILPDRAPTWPARESTTASAEAALPTVDLGYAKHKAVPNPNPNVYKFQNIRYAAPPVGDLRFKAPRPPLASSSNEVEDGSGRKECLQATVKWADHFPDDQIVDGDCCKKETEEGDCEERCDSNERSSTPQNRKLLGGFVPKFNLTDPKYYSEDCLHLDVWTPKSAFEKDKDLKAVFVWIYGGAYVFGGKSLYFPGGLMDRATLLDEDGIIFVSMNYRMGALGFAAGKDIADEDVNAGLLDQRQALKWVQEHIKKFGGDPDRVTIAGLSAGGGSVLHHLTAYGGTGDALFQRAISFSGGWQPITNKTRAETAFQEFMQKYNGVSNINELRKVSEEQIMQANYQQIYNSTPGTFTYNPTAWGAFAPQSPSKLLMEDKFHHDARVLLSHAVDEGGKFATAFRDQNTTLAKFLDLALPDLDADEREWVIEVYDTDEETDATDIGRVIGDAIFRCHVTYTSDAKYGYVYRQRWNTVRSNSHGGDLLYLFYQPLVPVASIRSARILQDYTLSFALFDFPVTIVRNPDGFKQPAFYQPHNNDRKVQYLDSGTLNVPVVWRGDPEMEYVCRVWQQFGST